MEKDIEIKNSETVFAAKEIDFSKIDRLTNDKSDPGGFFRPDDEDDNNKIKTNNKDKKNKEESLQKNEGLKATFNKVTEGVSQNVRKY